MIQNGTRPTKIDHRDWDFSKTFAGVATVPFPPAYNTDAGLTMPNQDTVNNLFNPPVPALPFGCTDYTTSEVATDLNDASFIAQIENPMAIEDETHANALGGGDIRTSLLRSEEHRLNSSHRW